MKARGGRRPGAGRPGLPFERRFVIGGQCEELWRRAIEENTRKQLNERTRVVRDQWKKASQKRNRSQWIKTRDYEEYLEDVRGAMQEDQRIDATKDDRDPDRLYVIRPRRPKNLRRQIIREVAAQHGVTKRMVLQCWKEYRRLERDV
ncbi:MAG: hypothetical protein IRZ28_12045 [Steroidobacteraceae bacterium]|nr:hypothetical protein [Steroidobacteraceae bacterium]